MKAKQQPERIPGALLIFLGLMAAYAVLTDVLAIPNPMIFPGWGKILPAMYLSIPQFLNGLLSSLLLLIPAVAAAIVVGVAAGILIGLSPRTERLFMPLLRAFNAVPATMLIPYSIAVMPGFWLSSASLIFIGVVWPILMNTLYGVVFLEPRWLENALCLNLRGRRLILKVVLPGAMPYIMAGINTSLIRSFLLLTVAEMFGAESGLGYFVQYYADFAKYDRVIGGMFWLSGVVVMIMVVFDRVQKRVLFWTEKR
ncbi:MAG: ABC transporter permease subunit [Planctomycetota bacterium]|jgi:NitT/TauT family transport system permease protein|nr:ABC transporter permease subunit [Planctomycetota bacterium]